MFKTLMVVVYYYSSAATSPVITSQSFQVNADGCEKVAEFVVESLVSDGYEVSAICVPNL